MSGKKMVMKVLALTNRSHIQRIEQQWECLSARYGFFHSPLYYNFYHPSINKLKYQVCFLAVMDKEENLSALLPTYKRRFSGKLLFFNGEANHMLLKPDCEEQVLDSIQDFLQRHHLHIHSNFIYEASPLERLYRKCGWKIEPWNTAYFADLSGGYEAYLKKFSKKTIDTLSYKRRKMEGVGRCEVVFTDSPNDFDEAFVDFVKLNQNRWGSQAVSLNTPSSIRQMNALAQFLLLHGKLFLSFYKINGLKVSAYFGVKDSTSNYYLQAGRNPSHDRFSLATLHMLEIFKWCCANGMRLFDFLPFPNEHKKRYATGSTVIYRNEPIG